jgi:hypothetical protein
MSKRPHLENPGSRQPEVQEALGELRYLRHHENRGQFQRDLSRANEDLKTAGLIPHMEIVATHHGVQLRPERGHGNEAGNEPTGDEGRLGQDSGGRIPTGRGMSTSDNRGIFSPDGRGIFSIFSPGGTGPLDPAGRHGISGRNNGYPRGDLDDQRYGNTEPTDPRYAGHGSGRGRSLAGLDFNATSYSGAHGSSYERAYRNAKIVAEIAREKGVPEDLAVATLLVESRGNERAKGDHGHSIGGFQLNDRGEGAGYSYAQKTDIAFNANVALSEFQRRQGWYADQGDWAAGSQRPKYPHLYAKKIRAMLPYARTLLES